MKENAEELRKQLKQMKGVDSLGSGNFNDLCLPPSLKFPLMYKCSVFENTMEKDVHVHIKLYGAAMSQYDNDNKLMVQTFPKSLTGAALLWFTEVKKFKSQIMGRLGSTVR